MSDAKQTVRQIEEAWARNDLSALDSRIAQDLNSHDAIPGFPGGLAGAKAAHGMFLAAFPDRKVSIDKLFGDGDLVGVQTTVKGTNTGSFMGGPATGRPIDITAISIYRLADGRVVEHWGLNDATALMMQLGLMPAPGAGAPA